MKYLALSCILATSFAVNSAQAQVAVEPQCREFVKNAVATIYELNEYEVTSVQINSAKHDFLALPQETYEIEAPFVFKGEVRKRSATVHVWANDGTCALASFADHH